MMDRHTTIEELLAVRDGEGTAWAKDHAATCAACAGELFRLEQVRAQMKALPVLTPPRDRWTRIAVAVKDERRARRVRGVTGLMAAAGLAALVLIAVRPAGGDKASEAAALDRAMARSQALEQTLNALSPETRALTGDAASAVAELEDHLARIDARLADPGIWQGNPGRAAQLWQERSGVLSALVDVHVTRVAQAGL
ncbi:MAG: hypothetical protein ACHQU1_07305 [Gemmatimonadales bacterium]